MTVPNPPTHTEDDAGVSSVVGVVLLIGIAVVVAGVAAFFIFGMDAPEPEINAEVMTEDRSDGSTVISVDNMGNAEGLSVLYKDANGYEHEVPLTEDESITIPSESQYMVVGERSSTRSLVRSGYTDHEITALTHVPTSGEDYVLFTSDNEEEIGLDVNEDAFDDERQVWILECGDARHVIDGPQNEPGFVDNNCNQIDVSTGTGPDHQHHVDSVPPGHLDGEDETDGFTESVEWYVGADGTAPDPEPEYDGVYLVTDGDEWDNDSDYRSPGQYMTFEYPEEPNSILWEFTVEWEEFTNYDDLEDRGDRLFRLYDENGDQIFRMWRNEDELYFIERPGQTDEYDSTYQDVRDNYTSIHDIETGEEHEFRVEYNADDSGEWDIYIDGEHQITAGDNLDRDGLDAPPERLRIDSRTTNELDGEEINIINVGFGDRDWHDYRPNASLDSGDW